MVTVADQQIRPHSQHRDRRHEAAREAVSRFHLNAFRSTAAKVGRSDWQAMSEVELVVSRCRWQPVAWADLYRLAYRALKKPSVGLEVVLQVFAGVAYASARSPQIHSGPAGSPHAAAYAYQPT